MKNNVRERFKEAKRYIKQGDYHSARRILQEINNRTARRWLRSLDKLEKRNSRNTSDWQKLYITGAIALILPIIFFAGIYLYSQTGLRNNEIDVMPTVYVMEETTSVSDKITPLSTDAIVLNTSVTPKVSATFVATATVTSTPTDTPTPLPTATISPVCNIPVNQNFTVENFDEATDTIFQEGITEDAQNNQFGKVVARLINSQGIEQAEQILNRRFPMPSDRELPHSQVYIEEKFVNVDDQYDLVINLIRETGDKSPFSAGTGYLLIFVCEASQYRPAGALTTDLMFDTGLIEYAQDLNNNGQIDFVMLDSICGNNCFSSVQIYEWDDGAIVRQTPLHDDSPVVPNVERVGVSDINEDGIYDVYLEGGRVSTLSLIYLRPESLVWFFDEDTRTWAHEMRPLPSDVRAHVLDDANRQADKGNFTDATVLYKRVISDTTLTDPMGESPGQFFELLRSFALFRLYMTYRTMDQNQRADLIKQEMLDSVGDDSAGDKFAEMMIVASDYEDTSTACEAVRDIFQTEVDPSLKNQLFVISGETKSEQEIANELCPY